MKNHAQATFAIRSWEEQTWDGQPAQEVTGAKLTRAQVRYAYQGDIAGEGTVQYLMCYLADGTGSFVGLEQIVGSIGGRAGSFVLQHTGTFTNEGVTTRVVVVPGSGTDALQGLRGAGDLDIVGHQEAYPFALDYSFA